MPKNERTFSRIAKVSRQAAGGRRYERQVTVRLDDSRLGFVTALAVIDETTQAEQIRLAAELYIGRRRDDPGLPRQVEAATERNRRGFSPLVAREQGYDFSAVPDGIPPARDLRSEKQVTLRLKQHSIDFCTSLALLDGTTIADQLRAAIDVYSRERLRDQALDQRITAARQDQRDLLARLGQPA